jgi:hypothetical protein
MSTAVTNGRPQRKQLSDQIVRLETLFDGLVEGLNDAIADACKEGTRTAVKEAITEVLAHPDLRAEIRPPVTGPATTPSRPSFWSRIKAKVAELKAAVARLATLAESAITARCWTVGDSVTTTTRTLGAAWRVRQLLLAGLGVAIVAATHAAPHAIVTAVTGAYAVCVAAAVAAWLWVRERTRRLLPA